MDEQLSLFGAEPEYPSKTHPTKKKLSKEELELAYLDTVLPPMRAAIEEKVGNSAQLSGETTKGYAVVKFGNLTVLRITFGGKKQFLSIPAVFKDLIPPELPQDNIKSDPDYIRIPINAAYNDVYAELFPRLATASIDRYPKEWDCCSRYLECSNAKQCVHPDKGFAIACGYRRALSAGKIFYGKNRNV